MYICRDCGREIEKLENFIRCPYCSCRILYKPALPVARVIKAK
ncbi:MAG: DNA-directed RNA polymerase subunit P [Candidatus Micrarchaeia archaeon]